MDRAFHVRRPTRPVPFRRVSGYSNFLSPFSRCQSHQLGGKADQISKHSPGSPRQKTRFATGHSAEGNEPERPFGPAIEGALARILEVSSHRSFQAAGACPATRLRFHPQRLTEMQECGSVSPCLVSSAPTASHSCRAEVARRALAILRRKAPITQEYR